MASTKKIGPCGGSGGSERDMNYNPTEGTRIVWIKVRHGNAINALRVCFLHNGQEVKTERWGGKRGNSTNKFTLQDSEYITSVKGHIGRYENNLVVTSLKFETNLRSSGTYGRTEEGNIPFELPAIGGQIIGFHGRSTKERLHALGVYVQPTQVLTKKVGPCGGDSGSAKDMNTVGITHIEKISISHGNKYIYALTVHYLRNGHNESTEHWGGVGGSLTEFELGACEYITSVKGYMNSDNHFVKSLTFETNMKSYGPYGHASGNYFELRGSNGQIIGFHGRSSDERLTALGVYIKVNTLDEWLPRLRTNYFCEPTQVLTKKVGPCGGGTGGLVRDMENIDGITRIVRIRIRHGDAIHALRVYFRSNDDKVKKTDWWGGAGGSSAEFKLGAFEYISSVTGHMSCINNSCAVKSLKFKTNLRSYGPYGPEEGIPFEFQVPDCQIIGFHGRSGANLHTLGVYVKVAAKSWVLPHNNFWDQRDRPVSEEDHDWFTP